MCTPIGRLRLPSSTHTSRIVTGRSQQKQLQLDRYEVKWRSHVTAAFQPEHLVELPQSTGHLRLFVISDLHTDYQDNQEWVKHLRNADAENSFLIVAGDISDDIRLLRETLQLLKQQFREVFFIPGNHELWLRGNQDNNLSATDSIEKLQVVLAACNELGVHTTPKKVGKLCIVPLHSWHHQSFDQEPEIFGVPRATSLTISDYKRCQWPSYVTQKPASQCHGTEDVSVWFDSLNSAPATQQRDDCDTVSFSHFLPHQHLLPEKRYLRYPNLAKAVGSQFLWSQVEQLKPDLHIFGHTHFGWDATIDGMRFIQAPLCYPTERNKRLKSIQLQMDQSWGQPISNLAGCLWLPLQVYHAQYDVQHGVSAPHSTWAEHEPVPQPQPEGAHLRWSGAWCDHVSSMWGDYYRNTPRDPSNTTPVMLSAAQHRRRIQALKCDASP